MSVLALIALSSACAVDPADTCSAICAGCCRDGVCQGGETSDACGVQGGACDTCVSGQVCSSERRCLVPSGAGGGSGGGAAGGAGGGDAGGAGGGGGGSACVGETDAALCSAAGKTCGPHSAVDQCRAPRSIVSCGSCNGGQVCSSGSCVCQPESSAALCQRLGKTCGTLSATDNCGAARSVGCGTCAGTNTCTANTCGCTTETNAQFCARQGRSCGPFSALDNCGHARSVTSCGSCVSPNTCGAGQCSCAGETNPQFCARLGAACGVLSGTDICGQTRNVGSCGSCYGSQTCGGGGTPNTCGCTPQTDAQLCAARSKDCGTLVVTDNCGVSSRTINCGACGGTRTCAGGGVANVCGCTAETNSAFCTRVTAQCGAVTAADNCGTGRTVASCGSCTSPNTCSPSNQCSCVAETNAALCARLGKTCGVLTATDNCLATRTITSCGSCGAGTACGAATNVCIATASLPTGVCTTNGFCWEMPRTPYDDLQDVWVEPSGITWAVGAAGTVLRWDGASMRGWRNLHSGTFSAVWSNGPNEVWVAGAAGLVLRWNGSIWEDLSIATTKNLLTLWGDGQGKVYVGGVDDTIRLWSNGIWTTPFHMPSTYDDVLDLTGYGAGLRIIGVYGQYEWNGTASTVSVVDQVSGWCGYTAQLSVSPTEAWAARYCWSNYSTTDTQQAYKTIGASLVWATLPSSTENGAAHFASRSASDVWLFGSPDRGWKFDGLSWTSAVISAGTILPLNSGHGSPARAAFVGDYGSLYSNTGSGWVNAADAGFPAGMTRATTELVVPISDTRAVVFLQQYGSSSNGLPEVHSLSIWNEGAWLGTTTLPTSASVVGAWSSDGTTAWALVSATPNALYRFNGTTWASVGSLPAGNYGSVAGTSANDQWVSGYGKMVHYDGTTFTELPTPYSGTSTDLGQLVAVSPSLAFARASDGNLIVWNGTAWSVDASIGASVLDVPMWKSPQGSVWAVTSLGLRKYAGGAWTAQPLPAGVTLGKVIYGSSDTDVTVSASSGACTWNGTVWACVPAPPDFYSNQRVVKTGARQWLFVEQLGDSAPTSVVMMRK